MPFETIKLMPLFFSVLFFLSKDDRPYVFALLPVIVTCSLCTLLDTHKYLSGHSVGNTLQCVVVIYHKTILNFVKFQV
jgi:hypothetical protein